MGFVETLRGIGVVAVIRGRSADEAVAMSQALLAGGVRGIEITYSTPDCAQAIARVARELPAGAALGVGTVRKVAQVAEASDAGATFAVSPHSDERILAEAQRLGLPMLPGAVTPTEVVRAWDLGASAVKLFPGNLLSPDYLKALRAPLPDIPLMPTGGVSLANMAQWFAAGAVAVGMGGNLASGEPAAITAAAQAVAAELERIRRG